MKSVYFVYLQDQKHKRTITQSKHSAVEEKAAATKRYTLTQAKNRKHLNKLLAHCQACNQSSPPKNICSAQKKVSNRYYDIRVYQYSLLICAQHKYFFAYPDPLLVVASLFATHYSQTQEYADIPKIHGEQTMFSENFHCILGMSAYGT